MSGQVLDLNGNPVLNIPPNPVVDENGNTNDKLIISAPALDSFGNPIPTFFKREIELTGDQIITFLESKTITIRGELQTSEAPSPVKFKISDLLKLRIYGTADFRVDY